MSNTHRILKEIPTDGGEGKVLRTEIYYSLGGFNAFTHDQEPRGYYFSVTPAEICPSGMVSMRAFSGVKTLIEPSKRFSQKKLDGLLVSDELITDLVEDVAVKNGINLLVNA